MVNVTEIEVPTTPPPDDSRRGPAAVRALWWVLATLMVVGALVFGTYQVVTLLAHEERVEVSSYPAAALTGIDVSNSTGSVTIEAADVDDVHVRAEISEGLRATGEHQQVVGSVLELRGTCPNFGSDWCRVDYEITVPRDLDVVVNAGDGSVDLVGVAGTIDVDTDNGSIELTGLTGPVRATNDNGRIEGNDLRSATVTADTDNGRVSLDFAAAPTMVVATTDNGSVDVIVPNDGESYHLDMTTDNGDRDENIDDDDSSDRSITIRTDNGDVSARTAP